MRHSRESPDFARIVALTPTPAIDRLYLDAAGMHWVVRQASQIDSFLDAPRINVARVSHAAVNETVAITALSEQDGYLATAPTPFRFATATSATQVSISGCGTTTNSNELATSLQQAQ